MQKSVRRCKEPHCLLTRTTLSGKVGLSLAKHISKACAEICCFQHMIQSTNHSILLCIHSLYVYMSSCNHLTNSTLFVKKRRLFRNRWRCDRSREASVSSILSGRNFPLSLIVSQKLSLVNKRILMSEGRFFCPITGTPKCGPNIPIVC